MQSTSTTKALLDAMPRYSNTTINNRDEFHLSDRELFLLTLLLGLVTLSCLIFCLYCATKKAWVALRDPYAKNIDTGDIGDVEMDVVSSKREGYTLVPTVEPSSPSQEARSSKTLTFN